jgi:hypothetical protein
MTHTSLPHRLACSAAVLGLTLSIAACGDDDPDKERASETTADPSEPVTEPVTIPISEHVLDELPGFATDGRAEVQSLRDFAEAHEKPVAELRASGLRSGSTLFFEGADFEGFALSVAGEYVNPEAAETEAERLFTSNTEGDPSIRTRPLTVPGVPDVRAASLHGNDGGTRLMGVEIVFVDGHVMHEVFAVGEASSFDLDAVVAAVTDLHDRVAGNAVP